jgi:hypothetical protein
VRPQVQLHDLGNGDKTILRAERSERKVFAFTPATYYVMGKNYSKPIK